MFVAENVEQLRQLVREEMRAATRELVTVHASGGGPPTDPEAILTYEEAGALVGQRPETVRRWTQRGHLRRYKCKSGRAVGVKRGELLGLWSPVGGTGPEAAATEEQKADAILRGKKGKK